MSEYGPKDFRLESMSIKPTGRVEFDPSEFRDRTPSRPPTQDYIHRRWEPYLGPLYPAQRQLRKAIPDLKIIV